MFYIQVITSGVFKGYVQGAGGPNLYILYISLYVLKAKMLAYTWTS
jgi:hypothetical protein